MIADSSLLESYFNDFFEGLHRYAYTLLRDNDDAKDIVQSVFLQLWRKKDLLQIRQSARSYLYTATHNHCLNHIRNAKKRREHETGSSGTTAKTNDLQKEKDGGEIKKERLTAMKSLPEKCREVFYKNRFEEKTYAEIAADLGISIKTVESQMSKALSILRTSLSQNAKALVLLWLLTDGVTQMHFIL